MDVMQSLRNTPLARYASVIESLGAPTAELIPRPDLPSSVRLGATRFGGVPDLPVGTRWPANRHRALTLLLQLDLADVGALSASLGGPTEGTLLFFYDVVDQPWGFRPSDRHGSRLLHVPAGAELRRVEPAAAAAASMLPEVAVEVRTIMTYPGWNCDEMLDVDEEFLDDFDRLYRQLVLGGDPVRHLVFGHPDPIQRDPVGPGGISLLQLDSDPLLGTMWGDSGKLHVTMALDAFAAAQFDRALVELAVLLMPCYIV